MSIIYSESEFVALGIQHAMRVRRVIVLPVICPAITYFPLYLIIGRIYSKKKEY